MTTDKINAIIVLNYTVFVFLKIFSLYAHAILGNKPLKLWILITNFHGKVVKTLWVNLPTTRNIHLCFWPNIGVSKVWNAILVSIFCRSLDTLWVIIIATQPIHYAIGKNELVLRSNRQVNATGLQRINNILWKLSLSYQVKPPANVNAVGHTQRLKVCLRWILFGIWWCKAVNEANARVLKHKTCCFCTAILAHAKCVSK